LPHINTQINKYMINDDYDDDDDDNDKNIATNWMFTLMRSMTCTRI